MTEVIEHAHIHVCTFQYSECPLNEIRPVFEPVHTLESRGIIKGVDVLFFSV